MTLQEAAQRVDRLAGNQISMGVKVDWLNRLDGTIHREIHLRHEGVCCIPFRGYGEETDPETPLLVPAPYDGIYESYLEMQVHAVNGEILKYNNAAKAYNAALLAYADYINRTCLPLGAAQLRLV